LAELVAGGDKQQEQERGVAPFAGSGSDELLD